ncbi:MAG TPA: hypothetical protein VD886_14510, partial [Herpetosiphonaceae bacterium]|nr:hypothetical protein [Herpetosiphonaceae bacterium]
MQRLLAKATLFVALSALLLSAFPGSAFAVTKTMLSDTGDLWKQVGGSYGHDNTGKPAGRYRFYMGHWNPSSNGPMEVQYDDTTPGFTVTRFENTRYITGALNFNTSASVYDTVTKAWSAVEGQSDLASGHFHAPAAYPSLYKGCHWADCSAGNGGPFPIQVSQIQSLPSTWEIGVTGPAATTGVWNASYDIWFDTNARGFMPGNPKGLTHAVTNPQGGQNDGAEIMIWLNNRGYGNIDNNPATPDGDPITPAGSRIAANVTISGKPYDVWFGRLQAPRAAGQTFDNPAWNVISYVGLQRETSMDLDTNIFIQDAASRQCVGAPGDFCLKQDWWLTSIQSGFEIWADGQGLSTKSFDVIPRLKATATEQVITGRTGTGGIPIIHWELPFNLRRTGCADGTASYLITDETGATKTGAMSEVQPGEYFASVAKLIPMHGNTTVKMTLVCPGG